MLGENFRPWGKFEDFFKRNPELSWDIVGCISFEERCLGLRTAIENKYVNSSLYLNILPPVSQYSNDIYEKLKENKRVLQNLGIAKKSIEEVTLMCSVHDFISPLKKQIAQTTGNVILDISTFPKRFFFPILKYLYESTNIDNLIVTYTKPIAYTEEDLSGDPSEWSHIPGGYMSKKFPEPNAELAIVGIGFMPLGLPKLLIEKYKDATVKLFFPFPPGPPNYQRNWDFVRQIFKSYPSINLNDMIRINALNTSYAFDKICNITNNGSRYSILAPYGPKPISLAMALYSLNKGVPVYYTQPNFYSPKYSTGIKETFCFLIKKDGKSLYIV